MLVYEHVQAVVYHIAYTVPYAMLCGIILPAKFTMNIGETENVHIIYCAMLNALIEMSIVLKENFTKKIKNSAKILKLNKQICRYIIANDNNV